MESGLKSLQSTHNNPINWNTQVKWSPPYGEPRRLNPLGRIATFRVPSGSHIKMQPWKNLRFRVLLSFSLIHTAIYLPDFCMILGGEKSWYYYPL